MHAEKLAVYTTRRLRQPGSERLSLSLVTNLRGQANLCCPRHHRFLLNWVLFPRHKGSEPQHEDVCVLARPSVLGALALSGHFPSPLPQPAGTASPVLGLWGLSLPGYS